MTMAKGIEHQLQKPLTGEELDALIVVYGKMYCYKWFPSYRERISQSKARLTQAGGINRERKGRKG
mgnify:CR=1 FL=1